MFPAPVLAELLQAPFAVGVLLSWSLAAPPGPANALIAHESARRGWLAGVATGMGAVTGDLTMFLLMWLGVLQVLAFVPALQVALGLVGAALMLRFAVGAWRSARAREAVDADERGGFGKVYLLIVTSPFNWAWWATAGTAMFANLGLAVVAGFFGGLAVWVLAWAAVALLGARRVRRFTEVVAYASAVLLAAFAAGVAWFSVRTAMGLWG